MGYTNKLTESIKSNSAIVLLDGSNVMLDELSQELLEVGVVVLGVISEGEVALDLVLNFSIIEGHQLWSQELSKESGKHFILVEFSCIEWLNYIKEVYFLIIEGG